METDPFGITSEERERLTIPLTSERTHDLKTSLLAFASLILIYALLVAASMIAN